MTTAALPAGLRPRDHHLPAAAAVAVATALLVLLPGVAGEPGRVLAVAVLQLALVGAWAPATGISGRIGAWTVGATAAVSADVLLAVPDRPDLGALLAVPGLGFLAAVLHQMARRPPRREIVASLARIVLLICAVCALAMLLLLEPTGEGVRPGRTALLVIGTTLVVGHLVDLLLPRPQIAPGLPRGVVGLVVAVLAGGAVALFQHGPGDLVEVLSVLTFGLVLGGIAALVGLAAGYVVAEGPRRAWAMPVVQAVLPVAACAPVAFSLVLQNAL